MHTTTNITCEGCPATDASLYLATQATGPDFEVCYCPDCAASYQGADMGAGGCEAQGTLTPVGTTINPYALATVILTREVEVCSYCDELAGECDHDVAMVSTRLWKPAVALGRIPVSAEDLTPAMVETVRAWVEGIRAERGWLTTTEERALASCDEDPAYCAEAYNALVRSGAVS